MSTSFRPTSHSAWAALIASAAGGVTLGAAAKFADQSGIAGLGDLGTYLGAWIVIATLIAGWSPSRLMAAVRVGTFLLAMVGTYYAVTKWLFGVFPASYFIAWASVALLPAPLYAVVIWPSRQEGWVPAFAAALPVGLLLTETYSLRWVLQYHLFQFVFDIAMAAVLFSVLPKNWSQRTKVLIFVPAVWLAAIRMGQVVPEIRGVLLRFGLRL